jgi:hypothetical protein
VDLAVAVLVPALPGNLPTMFRLTETFAFQMAEPASMVGPRTVASNDE